VAHVATPFCSMESPPAKAVLMVVLYSRAFMSELIPTSVLEAVVPCSVFHGCSVLDNGSLL